MQLFYEKYDNRLQEAGLSDEDRKIIEDSIRDLNGGIVKNKQNIINISNAISSLENSIEETEVKRLQNYDLFSKLTQSHEI